MRVFFGAIILLYFSACKQEKEFAFSFPEDFPEVNVPESNPMNESAILLGKKLFFDRSLSSNKKVSCASCHFPPLSFTDGASLGHFGVTKRSLLRHSPALINLAYADSGLFWDGGAKNLESLVFAPLTHVDEMGADLVKVNEYLKSNKYYSAEIRSIYQTEEVKVQYAAKAIAQYLRTLISNNSKYDQFMRGEATFTEAEEKGYLLFQKSCSSCHVEPLFTDNRFHNNGLDSDFKDNEHEGIFLGRFRISHDSSDIGKFKTPTLRNVMITAPYMHDGRLSNIEDVLNHYSQGVKRSLTLDSLLTDKGDKIGIQLSSNDKRYLTTFLLTLNDSSFLMNNNN